MNFLALCNRLIMEGGISHLPMTTTVGQTGEMGQVVTWTNAAWMDIQSDHQDWDWMRTSTSFPTVAGQAEYTLADIGLTDFGMWAKNTFRNYVTASGNVTEIFMDWIDYEPWRNSYQYGALRNTQSRPMQFTVTPAKGIGLGPVPAAGYTITGDYFRVPSEMTLDADIPALPTQFHMAIVYRAMMSYGAYQSAQEVYQRGEAEFGKIMRRIAQDRLPQIMFGGALA